MSVNRSISYHHTKQSIASRVFYFLIKHSGIKKLLGKQNRTEKIRKGASPTPPKHIPDDIIITSKTVHGNTVFFITPKANVSDKHILYLHGGAFVISFAYLHWKFMLRLVTETNCSIVAPDYPLSPEYSYKERFAMIDPVYKELIAKAGASNVIVMGDSAGGNIALSLVQKMKYENVETPSQVILLSPWLDISMTNPEIATVDKVDPLISATGSHLIQHAHAGDLDVKDFRVSPFYGALDGVGKISIFSGTYDILNPDARKLIARANAEGVPINYFEYAKMIHVWVLFYLPESRKAIKQIVALIKGEPVLTH